MKLYRVTSSTLPEIYIFAHGELDAVEIYRSFNMLLYWTLGPFQIEHVDRQVGWKQNRTLLGYRLKLNVNMGGGKLQSAEPRDPERRPIANYYPCVFAVRNIGADGFLGCAPVASGGFLNGKFCNANKAWRTLRRLSRSCKKLLNITIGKLSPLSTVYSIFRRFICHAFALV